MIVKKLPKRLFNSENRRMKSLISTMYRFFVIDRHLFAAKFPVFSQEWADEFGQELETADNLPLDSEFTSNQAEVTFEIDEKRAVAADKLRTLFRYVAMIWDDEQKSKAFGAMDFRAAFKNNDKMMSLLEKAHGQADEPSNRAVLLANGFTAFQISELVGLKNGLESLIEKRNMAKAARYEATRARVEGMNAIYRRARQINKAAAVVFADNPAKQDQYKLTPNAKPGPKKKKKPSGKSKSSSGMWKGSDLRVIKD